MVLEHDARSYTKYDYQFVLGTSAIKIPKHHEARVLPASAMMPQGLRTQRPHHVCCSPPTNDLSSGENLKQVQ